MKDAVEYPYLFIDEIINAKAKDLKFIDNLLTQQRVQLRAMYQGYLSVPNRITVAMSAIHKDFPDETLGRLVKIQLVHSQFHSISNFFEKWKDKMDILFAALYERLCSMSIPSSLEAVPNRRTGFALLKFILKQGFDLDINYEIEQSTNDTLDQLCQMHESDLGLTLKQGDQIITQSPGVQKGLWARYTPQNFLDYLNSKQTNVYSRDDIASLLDTSLPFHSTENHHSYKDGYEAESGKIYHLKIANESQGSASNKRRFIYIREIENQIKSNDSNGQINE